MPIDISNVQAKQKKKTNQGTQQKSSADFMSFLSKDIQLRTGLNDKKKEEFYTQVSILFKSGLDILTAFDIYIDYQSKKSDIELFTKIRQFIFQGDTLSVAVKKTKKFSTYEFYSIKIGEEGGKLKEVLEQLALFYKKKVEQRRQLMNALTYPVIVLITALLAVYFMLNFLVPMFEDVFKRFNNDLPGITKLIIGISNWLEDNSGILFLMFILSIAGFIILKKQQWFIRAYSKFTLKLPLIGKIINQVYSARFCQAMTLLTGSKVPLVNAVNLTAKMMSFYPYEEALKRIEADLRQGKSMHESMLNFKLFDKRVISLVKIGEEINKLEEIFQRLNEQISHELEHKMNTLGSLLEPFLILFVGVFVAIILISMYLPMFQLSTSFG